MNFPSQRAANMGLNFFNVVSRILVGLMMLALAAWIATGVVNLILGAVNTLEGGWGNKVERVIVQMLTLLAMLELWRTLYSYLQIGRVRVTFIIDAALVVGVGELIGLWYREHGPMDVMLSLAVILVLGGLRTITMRFSPEK